MADKSKNIRFLLNEDDVVVKMDDNLGFAVEVFDTVTKKFITDPKSKSSHTLKALRFADEISEEEYNRIIKDT